MANNKTLLWVGIGSAVLIGGGLGWWFYTKNKNKKAEAEKKKQEEEAKKKEEEERANKPPVQYQPTYQPTYQPAPSLPSTGFNQAEGDAFRAWHNKNYPTWKYKGDVLSAKGNPDNEFIRKAYDERKTEYDKYLADLNKPKQEQTATSSLDDVAKNLGSTPFETYTDKIIVRFTGELKDGTTEGLAGQFDGKYNTFDLLGRMVDGKIKYWAKGKWSDGGKKLILSNGRILTGSVMDNLKNAYRAGNSNAK